MRRLLFSAAVIAASIQTSCTVRQGVFDDGSKPLTSEDAVALAPQSFAIGNYQYKVESKSHVTEYVTNKTVNNDLIVYRIMATSDPDYPRATRCVGENDRVVTVASPSDRQLNYCVTAYGAAAGGSLLTGLKLAPNSIEVATDEPGAARVTISINQYTADHAYSVGRSRFSELCKGQSGSFQRIGDVALPTAFGTVTTGQFWMCEAKMAMASNSFADPVAMRVGAIFLAPNLPQLSAACVVQGVPPDCSSYTKTDVIEFVYVERSTTTNATAAEFARRAVKAAFTGLTQTVPTH